MLATRASRCAAMLMALAVLAPTPLLAQSAVKKVELAPGGRTIAGPAVWRSGAGMGFEQFLLYGSGDPVDLCFTLVNTGKSTIGVVLQPFGPGQGGSPLGTAVIAPGVSAAPCARGVKQVSLSCEPPGPCSALWRADQLQ